MKKIIFSVLSLILFISCSEDDKAIDTVFQEIERGAILRNIDRVSPNFDRTDLQSAFIVVLEEQDLEEGGIFDFVRFSVIFSSPVKS